jgi:hypothetical protein
MPRPAVWFIRLSLVYLALGFTFGALILANKGVAFSPNPSAILPAHIEILLMGWLVQLALGVAYWILPRFTRGLPRGNKVMAWLVLIGLNAGIILAAIGGVVINAGLVVPGRILEAVCVMAFLLVAWRRVRPSGL